MVARSGALRLHPFAVGLLLGVVQTGLLFSLSFALSSAFGTFLLVTFCWLLGSGIGLYTGKALRLPVLGYLLLALTAYFGCMLLLGTAAYNSQLTPLYAVLVILIGLYPGVFFRRASAQYSASSLLFRENNGFITGLAGATLLYMLFGRIVLLGLPPAIAVGIMLLERTDRRQ